MPITIVVDAQTEQASKALGAVFAQTEAGLNSVTQASAAANAGIAAVGQLSAKELKSASMALRSALSGLSLAGAALVGPQVASIIYPLQFVGKELKATAGAMKLLGVTAPMAVAGLAGLTSILALGGFAISAYRARLNELSSEAELAGQKERLLKMNIEALNDALRTGVIDLSQFIPLKNLSDNAKLAVEDIAKAKKELSELTTLFATKSVAEMTARQKELEDVIAKGEAAIEKSRKAFSEVGVSAGQNEAARQFQKLWREIQSEVAQGFEGDRLKANEALMADVDRIRQLTAQSKTAEKDKLGALEDARLNFNAKMAEIDQREAQAEQENNDKALRQFEENVQAQIRLKRELISSNFAMSDDEKFRASKAAGLNPLGPDPDSFRDQFGVVFAQMRQLNNLARETAQSFAAVFETAIASISSGITGLIMGTMTWREALQMIGREILTSIVGAIVQMAVRWIATKIIMAVAGKAIEAAAIAATAPMAAAAAAIWSGPAVLATIATGGGAAIAAPGLIEFAKELTLAASITPRAEGGPISAGMPYLVGEHGAELRTFDRPGSILNARDTAAALQGGKVNVAFFDDRNALDQHLKSKAGEKTILQIIQRNRIELGFNT